MLWSAAVPFENNCKTIMACALSWMEHEDRLPYELSHERCNRHSPLDFFADTGYSCVDPVKRLHPDGGYTYDIYACIGPNP